MGAGRHEARRHKGIRAPDTKNAQKKGEKKKKRKKYDPDCLPCAKVARVWCISGAL